MSAVSFIRRLVEAGFSYEDAMRAAAIYEEEVATLAPKKSARIYGPASDPKAYHSSEKARALAVAAAFIAGDPVARLPQAEWWPLVGFVLKRDGHRCTYCGAEGAGVVLHCDHIAPLALGGANRAENLTTACEWCNCSKGARLPATWLESLR